MENLNNTPEQAVPVSGMDLASSVSETGTPKASSSAPNLSNKDSVHLNHATRPVASSQELGLGAGAPTPAVKGELPKTTGNTVGGWNRFAGYSRQDAMNKKNERRDGKGRR
jgi:hypothetical protein